MTIKILVVVIMSDHERDNEMTTAVTTGWAGHMVGSQVAAGKV